MAMQSPTRFSDFLLPCVVALLGLASSLGVSLLATPGTLRVAVLTLPGKSSTWAAIDQSGLPIVQVRLGGLLVVLDATTRPDGLRTLRAANLMLLDASGIPGCKDPVPLQNKEKDHGSDT